MIFSPQSQSQAGTGSVRLISEKLAVYSLDDTAKLQNLLQSQPPF